MQQVVTEAPRCTLCSLCWGDRMCLGLCVHTQVTSPHAQPAFLSTSGCLAGTAQKLGGWGSCVPGQVYPGVLPSLNSCPAVEISASPPHPIKSSHVTSLGFLSS